MLFYKYYRVYKEYQPMPFESPPLWIWAINYYTALKFSASILTLPSRRHKSHLLTLTFDCDLNIICWTLCAVNALVDDGNNSRSPNGNKRLYEDEISDQLLHVPTGHHYLILYPDIETMRKVYASYIKRQLEEQPNSVVLFLSYYDTTDNVRSVLSSKGVRVKDHEKNGSMIILDIMKVLHNPYFQVPDIEKLRELATKTEKQFGDKTIFIIADMSVFNHIKKAPELLEYEKTLHKDLKIERWKELCLYNKRDFETMFTKDESKRLMEYHKDKVIIMN
jgi:hypothetical protein